MSKPYITVLHYQQERNYSCLPACVRMVLAFWGSQHPEGELRGLFKTKLGGTSPARVMFELPTLGFNAAVLAASFRELQEAIAEGLPCIAQVWTGDLSYWDEECMHAVVVAGVEESKVAVNDPAFGEAPIEIPINEFLAAWGLAGHTLIVIRRQA